MYKKILVGLDGSDESKRALQRVLEMKKSWTCDVVAFHATEHFMIPPTLAFPIPYTIPTVEYTKIREHAREQGKKTLLEAQELFKKEALEIETRLVEEEDPEEYAIRMSKEENFDLVALGEKGHHSKLRRVILGTVATKILNDAECDVLIVR